MRRTIPSLSVFPCPVAQREWFTPARSPPVSPPRDYHLNEAEAAALIEGQIQVIAAHWQELCDEAELSPVERKLFAGRQFLNNYALGGLEGHEAPQKHTAKHGRR